MYELDGTEYSIEEIEEAAAQSNLSVEEYLSEFNITQPEKEVKTPTTTSGADVVEEIAPDLESTSVDTSLESPPLRTSVRKQTRKKDLQRKIDKKLDKTTEDIEENFNNLLFENLKPEEKQYIQDIATDYLVESSSDPNNYSFTPEQIQEASKYILNDANNIRKEREDAIRLVESLDPKQSLLNAVDNTKLEAGKVIEFYSGESEALDIASSSLANAIFGQENVDEYVKKYQGVKDGMTGVSLTRGLGTKELLESIPKFKKQQERRKATLPIIESFKQGELLKGGAAILGTGLNVLGSVAYGMGTLTTGYFFDFAAENYVNYNQSLAERKNKTLEQLILDGEDNVRAPIGIAATQALAENIGLTRLLKGTKAGKILSQTKDQTPKINLYNKFTSTPAGAKTADILGAGFAEFNVEIYQGASSKYNDTLGKTGSKSKAINSFFDHLTSQEGLEEGLQGLAGASKIRAGGYVLKAINNARSPVDNEAIQKDIDELSNLNKQYLNTKNKVAKEGIQQKINEVQSRLESRITNANGVIRKSTPENIDEINNMGDLAELQVKRAKELNKEYQDGNINRKQYITALDGYKATYLNAKNRIKGIVDSVEVTPEEQVSQDIDNQVSEKNKAISDKNKINTDIILNPESTTAQIDKAKQEITEDNQGIINEVIQRSFKRDLDTDLTLQEFTADVGLEVQNLINSYGKSKKGKIAPFGAYLRENLPKRIPGIFDKQIQTTETGDIVAKVDISKADKELEADVEIDDTVDDVKERIFLSESIPLPDNIKNEVNKVVEDLYSKGKIPKIGSKEFTNFIDGIYKNELKPIMAKFIGKNTDASLETFLRENFKEIYKGIPQAVINKRFPAFKEPVLDKDGKQVREKTKQGNAVFTKKDITPAEFIKNFLGRDVGKSTQGTRKDALAETLAIVYANEASLNVLQDKDVQKKFKEIESLKPKDAIQKIDDLIKAIDTKYGRKSGKLYAGPVGAIADVLVGALRTIKLALKAGSNFQKALAKGINYIKNKLKSEAAADVVSSNIQTLEDLQNLTNKELDSVIEDVQEAIDTEVELGKQKVAFFTDLKKINIKNLLDLSRFNFEVNEKNLDKIKTNRLIKGTTTEKEAFIKQGKEIASAMPKEAKALFIDGKNGVLLQGLLGFHYRYVGSGKAPILYDNISTKSPAWVSSKTKDLFKKLPNKIISANDLKTVQEKINNAKTRKEKVEIAKNNLNKIKQHQNDVDAVFYAVQSLLTDYVYSAKNQNDLIKKLDYVTKIKSTNSNNINGDRALVKVNGFYVGPQGTKVKLEHVKTSSQQSIQALKQIISGDIDKNITNDFEGVYGFEFDLKGKNTFGFSKIDKAGKTNTSQYYRFSDTKDAKNYILAEYNFEGTIADKNILNLIKSKQKASKVNNKILPKKDQLTGDFTNEMVLDKMAEVDNINKEEALKFSESENLSKQFNDIIENKTGIGTDKRYAKVKARVAGAGKGKFNFFVPPSAEDFVGLLYETLGKGKTGDAQMAWYKVNLLDPYARAMNDLNRDRLTLLNDYKALKKDLKIVPKNLRKKIPGEPFTREQAVRVYIWDQQGMSIPGLSQTDLKELTKYVNDNVDLKIFGDQLLDINKGDLYAAPKNEGWTAGDISSDLLEGLRTTKRAKYLELWQQNVNQIFSETNLNKLEAAFGEGYRGALENILYRMKTGRNRSFGKDGLVNRATDWLTNSVGAIMFFNTRSAILQTISSINFINWSDNNILAAGKAFANIPQYKKDFVKLMNSPFLLARRDGLKMNVNEADIADMAKDPGSMARRFIAKTLRLGFLPTQIADSFAIASGGATFYRNRIKKYVKDGMSEQAAEKQAMIDFTEIAETSQQSSRPDKISQQQAGGLGRVILAFANTPIQYTREIKKAASDLKNGRGDAKTNISKIIYYGFVQNLIFNALQQALFMLMFNDEDEDESEKKKTKDQKRYLRILNSMSDQFLRGIGVGGAIVSTLKNTTIKLLEKSKEKEPEYAKNAIIELAQVSPPLGSKFRKLNNAGNAFEWNKDEMKATGWSLDNPAYLAGANVVSAMTNLPADRVVKKIDNLRNASNTDLQTYKRIASFGGWSRWDLDIPAPKLPTTTSNKVRRVSTGLKGGFKSSLKGGKLK